MYIFLKDLLEIFISRR